MTKKEFIEKIAALADITNKQADIVFDTVFSIIATELTNDEEVAISGFGTFKPKKREARMGINPSTKEKIKISASKTAGFKPSKALKDKLTKTL